MAFEIFILPRARNEFSDAVDWYESRQVGLGLKFIAEVEGELLRISENPYLFSASGDVKYKLRKAVLRTFPFLVIFRISSGKVLIQSFFHTHLDPDKKP